MATSCATDVQDATRTVNAIVVLLMGYPSSARIALLCFRLLLIHFTISDSGLLC